MGNSHSAAHRRWHTRRSSPSSESDALQLFLKPSGLYPGGSAWDDKRVRRLILRRDLAPRYPGRDEPEADTREECPICMLVYPMLNSMKCCAQRVCTECFLQLRPPRGAKDPCPFCKFRKIEVVFRGPRGRDELEKEERDAVAAAKAAAKAAKMFPTCRLEEAAAPADGERLHGDAAAASDGPSASASAVRGSPSSWRASSEMDTSTLEDGSATDPDAGGPARCVALPTWDSGDVALLTRLEGEPFLAEGGAAGGSGDPLPQNVVVVDDVPLEEVSEMVDLECCLVRAAIELSLADC